MRVFSTTVELLAGSGAWRLFACSGKLWRRLDGCDALMDAAPEGPLQDVIEAKADGQLKPSDEAADLRHTPAVALNLLRLAKSTGYGNACHSRRFYNQLILL